MEHLRRLRAEILRREEGEGQKSMTHRRAFNAELAAHRRLRSGGDKPITGHKRARRGLRGGVGENEKELHAAASNGDAATVKQLLDHGADPHLSDDHVSTPLWIAALNGHLGVVELLLDEGVDPDWDNDGYTPCFAAAQEGHADVVSVLLARDANPNWADPDGDGATPCYIAAQNGHAGVVAVLLAAGVNPNVKTYDDGETPCYVAAQNGHEDVVAALLAAGADSNKARYDGATPCYVAALNGHAGVVAALLAAGADPDQANRLGATQCYIAAKYGHAGVVEALLDARADPNKRRVCGKAPLHVANSGEIARLLLRHGALLDIRDENDDTPLDLAIKMNKEGVIEVLEEAYANAAARDIRIIHESRAARMHRLPMDLFGVPQHIVSYVYGDRAGRRGVDKELDRRQDPSNPERPQKKERRA